MVDEVVAAAAVVDMDHHSDEASKGVQADLRDTDVTSKRDQGASYNPSGP
jgi:hypothetical protein